MAIDWKNPKITIGEYEVVYSGAVHVHTDKKNFITFVEKIPGKEDVDTIRLEIKFKMDGSNNYLTMNRDEQNPGYVCITFLNVNDIIYGTTDFGKFPFLVDNQEYFITIFLSALPIGSIKLFSYSIFKKGL